MQSTHMPKWPLASRKRETHQNRAKNLSTICIWTGR